MSLLLHRACCALVTSVGAAVSFLWPVDAPVVDGFRPPPTPYGAGNRGIDFDTVAGQPVVAAAPGKVVFAGAVGRTLHVVVLHAGGVRTSYSFLQRVEVRRDQPVEAGDVVGRAGATLHFGVRVGAAYADPLTFLGRGGRFQPHLVRDDGRPPSRPPPDRARRPPRRAEPPDPAERARAALGPALRAR